VKIPCDHQKFSDNDCCGYEATTFYVFQARHDLSEGVAARCKNHLRKDWRSAIVDEDTYLVAKVMLT